jgi:putative membrane protein
VRQNRRVVPADQPEPDARFSLANERTFLAYVRTSLGLLAGGVAVDQLSTRAHTSTIRYLGSAILLGLGLVTGVWGYLRWRSVDRALQAGTPLPASGLPAVLATGLVVVCAAAALLVAIGR